MIPVWAKQLFHDHAVREPKLHEWLLNLYLSIERVPEAVTDFFPLEQVDDESLRRKFQRHWAEERKHEHLFLKALDLIGGVDLGYPYDYTYNQAVADAGCTHGQRPLRPGAEGLEDLAQLLVHVHVIEQRGLASFEFNAKSCRRYGLHEIERYVEIVRADEARHVAYSKEALYDLVGKRRGQALLREALRKEVHAHHAYSRWVVEEFLARSQHFRTRTSRTFYRFAAEFLRFHERLPLHWFV